MASEQHIVQATAESIAHAAEIIRAGGVVAFPTDTVYGLACDLFNEAAVERVYAIKGRPASMPLIAMFADMTQWSTVAVVLPEHARTLMARYWPGPLTVIAPARPDIPPRVLGGGSTIGMRIPASEVALQLLRHSARPLATTSANLSGQPSPCTADDVLAQLDGMVDMILDAGPCAQGTASTVIDCTVDPPRVLREGPLTATDLGL